MLFIPLVPHAQIERGSREEPTFCHAEKEASGKESRETLSEAREGTNYPPREGDSRKPEPRSGEFEGNTRRDVE